MRRIVQYSDGELKYFAQYILEHYYEPYTQSKKTIFLCGKNVKRKDSKRKLVASAILKSKKKHEYDVLMPEDFFGYLHRGVNSYDLDSMERELAKSVDYIIVIPESEGSVSELNAFIQHKSLLSKIMCLLIDAPKKAESYLALGPIKKLRNETGKVFKLSSAKGFDVLQNEILKAIEEMPVSVKKGISLNAFLSENFILPAVYLLEPLPVETMIKLYGYGGASELESAKMTTDMAIKVMLDRKLVALTHEGVVFSDKGFNYFMNYKSGRKTNFSKLNDLRVELLNRNKRNRKIRMG